VERKRFHERSVEKTNKILLVLIHVEQNPKVKEKKRSVNQPPSRHIELDLQENSILSTSVDLCVRISC
jgi:hypothetical protein